jgi:hypothetical protein
MARVFVMSDDLTRRVEIKADEYDGASFAAICAGHPTDNLVHDTHEMWSLADTIDVAMTHVDSCTRCADPRCQTPGPHDASDRCRKDS